MWTAWPANYGFDGIAVALLGGLGGGAVTLSAFFFGFLASGADYMETLTTVNSSIAVIVQALVILFVGGPRAVPATPQK